jgi:hypothetical protein
MSSPQTYDSLDGRMLHKEGRTGQYVRLSDYEALEKRCDELETCAIPHDVDAPAVANRQTLSVETMKKLIVPEKRELIDRPGN